MKKQVAIAELNEEKLREENFSVDLTSRQEPAGEIEVQFVNGFNPFSGLKVADVVVSYFPVEDAVCLKYRYTTDTYYQFWKRDGRAAFIIALAKYNEDYSAQNLVRKKTNETKNRYGSVRSYLTWQQYKYSFMSRANADILLGYVFKEKSPFFTITQGEAVYKDPFHNKQRNKSLGEMPMYLTRAQAADLASLFDQEFLRSLAPDLPDQSLNTRRETQFDTY